MARTVTVRELTRDQYTEWTRFAEESPDGSPYALPAYLDVLCDATGGRYRIVAVFRGQEIVGGVALYEERRTLGTFVTPRLLLQYNGPVLKLYGTKYPSVSLRVHSMAPLKALRATRVLSHGSSR